MKKISLLIAFTYLFVATTFAQAKHHFEIKNGSFIYDGSPIFIRAGEMHFARVPKPYWEHRLKMIKAMGLNAVATYVFWNYHETAPGVWDFKTESRNIRQFIKLAEKIGLLVILRPGPYACAEWEFGGYPWWLQNEKKLVIRGNNKPFLDSCQVYINHLVNEIKDLQITQGGPIVMVQAENEFGSYVAQRKDIPLAEHKAYSHAIKDQLVKAGVTVPLFTSDGSWLFEGGSIKGALPTANGEGDVEKLKKIINEYNNGMGPYMVAEFYPGWLDHWNEKFQLVATKNTVKQTEIYLKNDVSFNYYMIHGGTNFAFTSGANYNKEHHIQPDITSYDYDAPISEAGWATEKYIALRELLTKYVSYKVPAIPKPIPVIAIPSITLSKVSSLFKLAEKMQPVICDTPITFEGLNQGNGYIMYSRKFTTPVNGKIEIQGLRDYAVLYVNKKKVGVLNRNINTYSCEINIPANATLDILVENMGRINYGAEIIHNLKGIIAPILINGEKITGNWKMYKLPMDNEPDINTLSNEYEKETPVIYSGSFAIKKLGDTFLDMEQWGKGIVFINGHHIGRYWSIGPQQTLYVPGCWLKKGKNTITVFEQLNADEKKTVSGVTKPVLTKWVK